MTHGRESADMARSKKKPISRSRLAALLVILVLMAVMHESLIRKIAKTKQAA